MVPFSFTVNVNILWILDDTNLKFGLNYNPTNILEAHYGWICFAGTILSN